MVKMKKFLILSLVCLLTLCGCGKIPTLKNGEEAVVTFAKDDEEYQISAEELFEELKTNFGLEATLKLIDTYILEKEYDDYVEEAKENAKNYIEAYVNAYGSEENFLNMLRQSTNYSSIDAYEEYLYLSFMQSHALEEYAKSLVTDKEVEDYYNDKEKEDIEVYHILITSKATDSMTADEKKQAETDAQNKVKDLIKKLDEADDKLETFKTLAKENSEDDATKDDNGNLGYINYHDLGDEYDELLDAAYKLKDGEYSKSVITTELGYHVIYRNASRDKASLKDLKDEIIEDLANEKLENTKTISVDSMKNYRGKYNMKIIDDNLNRQYGIYLNNLANSSSSQED